MKEDSHRLVHLDLKGAPPRVGYYEQLFPWLQELGVTGLLIEYEDMFPYWGELKELACPDAYTKEEIRQIQVLAREHELNIIPLVQTFGHFEFVLKHDKFRHLREVPNYPMALCPSREESYETVTVMIDQIMELHDDIQWFHIGADEVFHLGLCEQCQEKKKRITQEQLFVGHVKRVANYVKNKYSVFPVMWDDMFRTWSLEILKESDIGRTVEPMVWLYHRNLSNLPKDIWMRYSQVFKSVWFASAFKGATGSAMFLTDPSFHLENHVAWMEVMKTETERFQNFRGITLTGWQRYDHYAVLCELIPSGLPCLALCLQTLLNGRFSEEVHKDVSIRLGFNHPIPLNVFSSHEPVPQQCSFPGHEVFLALQVLLRLNAEYEIFLKDDGLNTWMTPYHIRHNFTNPVHVEQFLPAALRILENLHQVHSTLETSLSKVFYQSTVDEWLVVNLTPKITQITEIVENAKRQIQLGGRPKEGSTMEGNV